MQFIPSLPKKLFLTFGRLNIFCWVCLTFSALNIYGHPAIAMSLNSDFTVTGIETVPKNNIICSKHHNAFTFTNLAILFHRITLKAIFHKGAFQVKIKCYDCHYRGSNRPLK